MAHLTQNPTVDEGTVQAQWKRLYRLGGAFALAAAVLFLSDIVVMLSGLMGPASAGEWFALMQRDRLAGVLDLFFSDLLGLTLLIPFAFSLYGILRRTNAVYAALAAVAFFVGLGIVFAVNPNYSLLALYDRYTTAGTEVEKAQILTAAEALLTAGMQGTGLIMNGLLIEGALAAFSVLMLRSSGFGRGIGWLGILAHGLDCLHSIALLVLIPVAGPELAGKVSGLLLAAGGTLQLAWYPLAALRLFQAAGKFSER
jgi:hypothetical protein